MAYSVKRNKVNKRMFYLFHFFLVLTFVEPIVVDKKILFSNFVYFYQVISISPAIAEFVETVVEVLVVVVVILLVVVDVVA